MNIRKTMTLVLALAVALLIVLTPGSGQASEEIKLLTSLNFDGINLQQSTWNRLEVHVLNNGSEDLLGTLVVNAGGNYTREVFVQAGNQAKVIIYLPPMEVAENWAHSGSGIKISLVNQRGRELASARINTSMYGPQDMYTAVLGNNPYSFGRLANVLPGTQVVGINPGHLDNLLFAQNYRAIIISDPGSITLNTAQQINLSRWVEAGGVLIIGGGGGWQQSSALVPEELLPVRPRGIETVRGVDLGALKLPVPPEDIDYTIAVGDVQGTVLMKAGSFPLLVRKAMGKGSVFWSALDLEGAPLENQANIEAFWQEIFVGHAFSTLRSSQPWAINQLFNSISQDSLASTLSPSKILLLLLIYIVLVGPVNWLVLRKTDRREWAWVTIPVLALLFTTGAFAVGRIGRGNERVLYQLNLVDVYSENLASVRSYNGVFVPRREKITLTSSALGLAPMELQGVSSVEAGQSILEFPNPPLWAVQRFYGSDIVELPGDFSIAIDSSAQIGSQLKGEITNNSGQDMFDSFIRMGNRWYPVGPLKAGESKSFNVASQYGINFHTVLSQYSKHANSRFDIEQLLIGTPSTFVGFSDNSLLSVMGAGESVSLDIWLQAIDLYNISFLPGPLNIPSGVLNPVLVGGERQHGEENTFEGQGSFDLVFTMPAGADYSQGDYNLNIQFFWGEARGAVEVYDFAMGKWRELGNLDMLKSQNVIYSLDNPEDLVRDNSLTVRVNYDGYLSFSLSGIDITVEGGRIND